MAIHSSILAWKKPMDRGAWRAINSPWSCKSDTTQQLNNNNETYFTVCLCCVILPARWYETHFLDEVTEGQSGQLTYPKAHSWEQQWNLNLVLFYSKTACFPVVVTVLYSFYWFCLQMSACLVAQLCPTLCDPTAHEAPLSMEFSQQEHWSGLPFVLQGIFLTQGQNPCLLPLLHCRQTLYCRAAGELQGQQHFSKGEILSD